MRTAIYARVSTTDQADKGYSLPSQIEACQDYVERLGYSVAVELREDCSGAIPVAERPQGQSLTKMVMQREIDVVVVHQVDRLSRDIVDLLQTVRTWIRAGVEIHAGDVGKIENELDIVLVIKGWQGSDERKKIRERSMRGKRAKAKTGKVVGGCPPYGYHHVRDEHGKIKMLEPYEPEAGIIRLIYKWYVYGDETGKRLSAKAIARRLTIMRVTTPGELKNKRKRDNATWWAAAIRDMIIKEVYAGVWRYGVLIGNTRKKRPETEHILVEVPAIVDRKTWLAAQEQIEANKQFSKRNAKNNYLLRGLIRCGKCNQAMCGRPIGKHLYYVCSQPDNHFRNIDEICNARSVRADILDIDIWVSVLGVFQDTDWLNIALKDAQEAELRELEPKQDELMTVNAMIADAEREAVEIGLALRQASGVVGKMLKNDANNVNKRYDALCSRRDKLQMELSEQKLTDNAIERIIQYAEDVRVGMENADYETARLNLEMLKVRIIIEDGRFYVTCLAGKWDGDISASVRGGGNVSFENASHPPS